LAASGIGARGKLGHLINRLAPLSHGALDRAALAIQIRHRLAVGDSFPSPCNGSFALFFKPSRLCPAWFNPDI
jgi:hypothetical protein